MESTGSPAPRCGGRKIRALLPEGELDGYRIGMRQGTVEILPGRATTVWTYDGLVPGPCIRQAKGRASVVRFVNELQDSSGNGIPTSIHLHGVASLPQYDGYAEDLILFWYHDHTIEKTSRNVYMGLAGMYLVDYDDCDFQDPSQAERLPSGEYDIPLVIQDKRLDGDGQLIFNDSLRRSLYGDVMLVNGVPWPRLAVTDRNYRFRILNAGTSRVLNLGLQAEGDGPPAYEQGIKDTFFAGGFLLVEMIGRFDVHQGNYMTHCHNLVHEDHDMMTRSAIGSRECLFPSYAEAPCLAARRAISFMVKGCLGCTGAPHLRHQHATCIAPSSPGEEPLQPGPHHPVGGHEPVRMGYEVVEFLVEGATGPDHVGLRQPRLRTGDRNHRQLGAPVELNRTAKVIITAHQQSGTPPMDPGQFLEGLAPLGGGAAVGFNHRFVGRQAGDATDFRESLGPIRVPSAGKDHHRRFAQVEQFKGKQLSMGEAPTGNHHHIGPGQVGWFDQFHRTRLPHRQPAAKGGGAGRPCEEQGDGYNAFAEGWIRQQKPQQHQQQPGWQWHRELRQQLGDGKHHPFGSNGCFIMINLQPSTFSLQPWPSSRPVPPMRRPVCSEPHGAKATTRLFRHGHSQAVPIPAELAYDRSDLELEIEREGL